jgi:serine/threonine-protein kinase SRPK3
MSPNKSESSVSNSRKLSDQIPIKKTEKKETIQQNYNEQPVYPAKYTDSDNSEDEGMEDYKVGGYHPVHVGEVYLHRYLIMQKLGWGHFSTVWLAKDLKYSTYVAIKIQKSAQHYLEAAYDEVEILQELEKHNYDPEWEVSIKEYWKVNPDKIKHGIERDHSQVVQLLNSFIHHGPNGKHFCMVFEIMGVTLLEIIKRYNYKGIPIPYVRIIAKQILIGLDFLHRMCGIIHTDLKPENVLLCLTDEEIKEISDTGYLDISKKKKHNNSHVYKEMPEELSKDLIKKKKKNEKKKKQKLKKKQAKKLQKMGMEESEIKKVLENLTFNIGNKKSDNDDAKAEDDKEEEEMIEIDELIERPKIQSTPKYTYDLEYDEKIIDFDISEYSKKLQTYIRERNKIINDNEYRKELIQKKKLLEQASDEKEKLNIMKSTQDRGKKRGPGIDDNAKVKIVDLGNACWFHHHFSTEIQTRQYRSPEVILGINYGPSADIWSFACMIFELITGDFLFEPRKGESYSKNDDHLAQIMELLGKMPRKIALSGRYSKKYFTRAGTLRRIKGLQFWPLKNVLMEKYRIKESEAIALTEFLMPMLNYYPERRATAQEMLNSPWLNMPANFDYSMNEREYERMIMIKKNKKEKVQTDESSTIDIVESDNELNQADDEDNEEYFTEDYESDESCEDADVINIQNFNNSFAAYGQHVNLAALDRANPQFQKKK